MHDWLAKRSTNVLPKVKTLSIALNSCQPHSTPQWQWYQHEMLWIELFDELFNFSPQYDDGVLLFGCIQKRFHYLKQQAPYLPADFDIGRAMSQSYIMPNIKRHTILASFSVAVISYDKPITNQNATKSVSLRINYFLWMERLSPGEWMFVRHWKDLIAV